MIQSKRINLIIAAAMALALILGAVLVAGGNMRAKNGYAKTEAKYASALFGADIISIEIIADKESWQEMLDNAASEQYIMADVIVNGTRFQNVGVRPKGNSSLKQVASSDSDRYSFRLQFNEYIKGQTCFGLESFVVNNMLGDNSYMKEYVSYELMKQIGVDAPYFGYADMKVNGEPWGLYLAVELYNDSYEQRVSGDTSGMLYNVKSMDMDANNGAEGAGGGNNQPFNGGAAQPGANTSTTQPNGQDNNQPATGATTTQPDRQGGNTGFPAQPENESGGMNRAFGQGNRRGSAGGSLEYTDDNTSSYSAIFGNVVGKGSESDFQRVVQAIKALSEEEDLEKYLDVDQILRYLAAHTLVVNLDSYSSSMAQNYYIYERDGQITVLPWDYNLAWGGFQSGSASSVVNFPIDTPVSGVEMSSRPLIEKLFSNAEYPERYHSYLRELTDSYFSDGRFEEKIRSLDSLIAEYVKSDATAFCSYEEYQTAVESLITLGNLRAESVRGQLDGEVPSTTAAQQENPGSLISAEGLNLSDLGSMMGGGNGRNSGFPGGMDDRGDILPGGANDMDAGLMSKAMEIITRANGEIGDQVKEELLALGLTEEQIEMLSSIGGRNFGGAGQSAGRGWEPGEGSAQDTEQSAEQGTGQIRRRAPSGNAGGIENPDQEKNILDPLKPGAAPQTAFNDNILLIGALMLALAAVIVFAAGIKRNY